MTSTRAVDDRTGLDPRIERLEARLDGALSELGQLRAVESIRTTVLQFCRGLDRMDRHLMSSVFVPDATVDYGKIFQGPVAEFVDATLSHQRAHTGVQHLVGNIVVQVDGDRAVAESYELAHHTTAVEGGALDFILAMRTLDQLERTTSGWKIRHRTKVSDWSRTWPAQDPPMGPSPLAVSTRDTGDLSYGLFAGRPWPTDAVPTEVLPAEVKET